MESKKGKLSHKTKVKVCHLSSLHKQLDSRIFYRECISLAKAGYQVCLICPCGRNGIVEKVKIVDCLRWNNRFLRMILSPLIVFPALKINAKIYHFHAIELIPTGLILKLLFRKKVVYDVHEDFPSMMLHKLYIPKILRTIISKAIYLIEQMSTRVFDGIVTADPFVLNAFPHVPSNRKMVFYNLPSLDIFKELPHDPSEKSYDIVYLGGMSERAGTFILIEAIQNLVLSGLKPRILLIGYFDNDKSKVEIMNEVIKRRLGEYFDIRGRVPHQEVPKLLSKAKIGVVSMQPVPKFLKNIPSKLFEYLACGLPVVVSDLPPIRIFFKNKEYGFLVDPKNPKAFAEAFYWLMTNPEQAELMGKKAQIAVREKLNCKAEGEKLAHFYEHILSNGTKHV
jgi:glycosyltransferase involved in cell wall biosynthesis